MPVRAAAGRRGDRDPDLRPDNNYRLTPTQLEGAVDEQHAASSISSIRTTRSASATPRTRSRLSPTIARERGRVLHARLHVPRFRRRATRSRRTSIPKRSITIYSFSKWLGLAGLRIGALVAEPDLIERLAAAPPNNLGCNVDCRSARRSRACRSRPNGCPTINRRQRRNQAEILKAVAQESPASRSPVYPSQANFLVRRMHRRGHHAPRRCARRIAPRAS